MRPDRLLAPVLAAAALLATSCSAQQDAPASPLASPPASPPAAPAASSAASAPTATPTATPTPTPAGPTMTISGFEYVVPAPVRPGAQVTVVNQDPEAHTVTLDGGAVRLSVLPGATAVFTAPTTPGAHVVTCDLHGGMDAVLVVA